MISLNTIGKIFYSVMVVILFTVASIITVSNIDIPNGIKIFAVQSGSMEPTIHVGSIVITKPFQDYKVGDIVTFKTREEKLIKRPKQTTTHRIYEVKKNKGQLVIITKGDANNAPDINTITEDLILGKIIIIVPLLGFFVNFTKTFPGLIILIIIPATIIIYSELLNIKNETIRLLKERKERKERKLTTKERVEVAIGKEEIAVEKGIRKLLRKLPFFAKATKGKEK